MPRHSWVHGLHAAPRRTSGASGRVRLDESLSSRRHMAIRHIRPRCFRLNSGWLRRVARPLAPRAPTPSRRRTGKAHRLALQGPGRRGGVGARARGSARAAIHAHRLGAGTADGIVRRHPPDILAHYITVPREGWQNGYCTGLENRRRESGLQVRILCPPLVHPRQTRALRRVEPWPPDV